MDTIKNNLKHIYINNQNIEIAAKLKRENANEYSCQLLTEHLRNMIKNGHHSLYNKDYYYTKCDAFDNLVLQYTGKADFNIKEDFIDTAICQYNPQLDNLTFTLSKTF